MACTTCNDGTCLTPETCARLRAEPMRDLLAEMGKPEAFGIAQHLDLTDASGRSYKMHLASWRVTIGEQRPSDEVQYLGRPTALCGCTIEGG